MNDAASIIASSQPSIMDVFAAFQKSAPAPAAPKKPKQQVRLILDGDDREEFAKAEEDKGNWTLEKSLQGILNGGKRSIERLAFETDPSHSNFNTIFKPKVRGVPDTFLKRIAIQDDLVAAIVRAREMQIGSFGRPRPTRFSTGYDIEPNAGVLDKMTDAQKEELHRRIELAIYRFSTCGDTDGLTKKEQMSFAQYLQMSARNAVILGRIATEVIRVPNVHGSDERFHHFRPVDVGTIYHAAPQRDAQQQIREQARRLLEQIKDRQIEPERFVNDEYAWIQVIENTPREAFTEEELLVYTFDQILDVESDGYPITPIDTMINAVTTHLNITKHNQIYFQTGRASRGMLVFRSDDVDENTLARVKQQFQASINSVNNAWRMPVFAVSTDDEITWEPIDNSSRDMEFQYLTDMNARVILSAFLMSPDELPGWAYLSRGTSNQALSESNNEYRLEAARDIGIRPLLMKFEDFVNHALFPLIDAQLAKLCRFKLVGLDADTEEKESIRLQQDMPVHMTYNEVMQKVEKKPIPKQFGGDFPLNPQLQSIMDKYVPVGLIMEHFLGMEGASKDPDLQYRRDPFYFQQLQLKLQSQQAAAAPAPAPGGGGGPPDKDGEGSGDDGGSDDDSAPAPGGGTDLSRSIDQAMTLLTKNENQLPLSKRKLLAMHRRTLDRFQLGMENDLRVATRDIVDLAERHLRPN
jgi:hypothetical protein